MTTLISWITFDNRGFAAAYMASDSRISWADSPNRWWDTGRKLFISKSFPDIFGYAGDVIFPALALGQIADAVDAGLMFGLTANPWERHEVIVGSLKDSFARRHRADNKDFDILHLSRYNGVEGPTVHAWSLHYDANNHVWTDRLLPVPDRTGVIERIGSGAHIAKDHQDKWGATSAYSREIFSSFCDAISDTKNGLSGGAPQLAGFYPSRPAQTYGILFRRTAYFNGLPVTRLETDTTTEWRDELFQRIDVTTGFLLAGAQAHARPKGF